MTKLKNTKKGMAKKALSISLVAAMLATSNVPVWAAEFSDGSDVAPVVVEQSEDVDVFSAEETPVAEEVVEDVAPLSTVITEGDVSVNLTADKKSVVWSAAANENYKVNITGSVTKADGSELTGGWKYRWVDESGIVAKNNSEADAAGTTAVVADMGLQFGKSMAGKTLTLHVYDTDSNNQYLYDITTDIKVTVEKRELESFTIADTVKSAKSYNGFAQTFLSTEVVDKLTDKQGGSVSSDDFTVTVTTATKVGEKITATVTANPNSAYVGSLSKDICTIVKKEYENGDIVATAQKGMTFQYTGKDIYISKDKVTLKESLSANGGADGKLSGADLSAAIKSAKLENKNPGDQAVFVTIDESKLDNINVNANTSVKTEETITVAKRDLSTAGTKITVNTLSGQIPTNIAVNDLHKYLVFTGTEGVGLKLDENTDYSVSVKNADGSEATSFKNGSTYTVTVRAKDGGYCEKEQTFNIVATAAALKSVTAEKQYKTSYTGEAITPSKSDIGNLIITYFNEMGIPKTESLGTDGYDILGYTNNVNATTIYGANNDPLANAYVNIKITSGTYEGKTASIPFLIKPLEVRPAYVTVPANISINKTYTKAEEYKVPVTVKAKDETGKKIEKTLTADDYTVKYEFSIVSGKTGNVLGNEIKTTVIITNPNYILGTEDAKTKVVKVESGTEIVAKKLTDAMVVVAPSSYTYTGGKIEPTYAVIDGAITLYKKGEVDADKAEYEEVSITNAVNVGTGTITVKGLNDLYSGTAKGTFTITPANTSDVKVAIDDQAYTGRQVRPRDFKVTLKGNDVTSQFEIVSYGTNVEAGKGTVVLKAIDSTKNFTGSNITAEFNIVKETIKADLKVYDAKGFDVTKDYKYDLISTPKGKYTFDGNEKTFAKTIVSNLKKVTKDAAGNLVDGKTTATVDDIEIKYVDNVSGKKVKTNLPNVAYVYAVAKEGTGFAGGESIVTADGTVIKGVVAMVPFAIDSVQFVKQNVTVKNGTYAGGLPVKPEVLIQIGGSTLVEGKDYTVELIDKTGKTIAPVDVTVGQIYGVKITGINGYVNSGEIELPNSWGVSKKNISDCNVTVKDGVVSVLNGYLPVPATEYTSKNNDDGTYTITAATDSKNYTGSKTVKADGKAEDEKPDAPMIVDVQVTGNNAKVILSGEVDGATGYDYVIGTDRDCITTKDYDKVNKNIVKTNTTFTYTQQGTYYAYCHAWKRDENGKKVFGEWSNAYPFVVTAITPEQPGITSVKVSGSTVTVTYTKCANATGYDVVLGSTVKKVNGERRPVNYGTLVKKINKGNKVTAVFKNVPKGTYYAGLHSWNRTSENGKKVFSPWSNTKKVNVK